MTARRNRRSLTAEAVERVLARMREDDVRPSIEKVRAATAEFLDGKAVSLRQTMRPTIAAMLDEARADWDARHGVRPEPAAKRSSPRRTHAEEIASRDREIARLMGLVETLSLAHVSRRARRSMDESVGRDLIRTLEQTLSSYKALVDLGAPDGAASVEADLLPRGHLGVPAPH